MQCPSVRLSCCPSRSCILSKRVINVFALFFIVGQPHLHMLFFPYQNVYTCFVSGIIYPKKAVRALITFSQTPQLEGLAALAPRTAYPAPGPAFYRRRSNVLCHRKSLCLSVFCLSSVTSLHPLSALLFIVIRRVNEW